MARAIAHPFWRVHDLEKKQHTMTLVAAPDIPTAIEVYLSQDSELEVGSITKVELVDSLLIDEDSL